MMWHRTIDSLRMPKDFFSDVKPERGFKNPFFFMFIVLFITMIFLTYHHIELFNSSIRGVSEAYEEMGLPAVDFQVEITFGTYVGIYLFIVISTVLLAFLWYYVTHLCVKLLGGKHGYDQTYKVMSYSHSADYLSLPSFAIWLVSFTYGLSTNNIIAWIVSAVAFVVYLIPLCYRCYLRLVGLEKLQEISKIRAFIAAYILAYIFVFIIMFIVGMIISIILLFFVNIFGLM